MYDIAASMEELRHQNNTQFPEDLDDEITRLRSLSVMDKKVFQDTRIGHIIEEYTNIRMKMKMISGVGIYIDPPIVNKNHQLWHKSVRHIPTNKNIEKIVYDSRPEHGWVDERTGKIGGVFLKMQPTLLIPKEMLRDNSKLTVEMVTAFILHEVGHAYYFYELASRVATTNFAMDMSRQVLLTDGKVNMYRFAKALTDKGGVPILDHSAYASCNSIEEVAVILTHSRVYETRSESTLHHFDFSTNETLADRYVSKYGRSRDLAVGLDIWMRSNSGLWDYWKPRDRFFVQLFTVIKGAGMVAGGLAFGYPFFAMMVMYYATTLHALHDHNPRTYDPPRERFIAIRNDLRGSLKYIDEIDVAKGILRDIDVLNDVIKNTPVDVYMGNYLLLAISPRYRAVGRVKELQHATERMVQNQLVESRVRLEQIL